MSLNNSQQAIIDNRRRLVASLRLRGATQREIVSQLATNGHLNPDTGEPWALGTVNSDLKALEIEWKAEAARDITEHKARQLAELVEVKRSGWSQKDLDIVLKALKQETDILGTNAPTKMQQSGELTFRIIHDDAGDGTKNTLT